MSPSAFNLARLLSTNDPLDPDEKQHARSKVTALNKRLEDLRLLCEQLENELAEHKLLLSLSREIPNELLGAIFELIIPPVVGYESKQDLTNLRLVCKKWRDAAEITHRLWSGLAIDVEDESLSFEKIAAWYSRSGDVRRSLVVFPSWHSMRDMDSCQLPHPVLCRLLTEGPVIDNLTISCTAVACLERFAQVFHSDEGATLPWHAIRSCTISFETEYWTRSTSTPEGTTIFPPSLSSLTFTSQRNPANWGEDENVLSFIQPTVLQHLTYLNLQCLWRQSLLSILSALQDCNKVETLVVAGGHEDTRATHTVETSLPQGICLPQVKTLRIGGTCAFSISLMLKTLQTPNAVNLDIDLGSTRCCTLPLRNVNTAASADREIVWWSRISANLAAFKRLRHLRIRSTEMNSSTLTKCLKNFPSLTHITLENIWFKSEEDPSFGFSKPSHQRQDSVAGLDRPCIEVVELLGKTRGFDLSYIQDLVGTGAPKIMLV
ncbi:hypothetical protein H1R20_g80, partial [Candolleomyces eurysporus]